MKTFPTKDCLFLFLSFLMLFACRNTETHLSKFQKNGALDTIYHENYNLLTGINTNDSAQITNRIIDFALFELKKRPNTKCFRIDTTSELIDAPSISHFVQGNLFDKNTTHAFLIRDVNFDGTNDLLMQWGYSSGRCNCHFGCYDLYAYNSASHHFTRQDVFQGMLETVIVPNKKYIILGVHCHNYYTKNYWKEDKSEPFDSVFFECKADTTIINMM